MTGAFSEYQLRHFRGLQGLLLQKADLVSSSELMSFQEKIEEWVSKQMQIAVVSALSSFTTVPWTVAPVRLLNSQVVEFRELQAEAFVIAKDRSFDIWKEKQHAIEKWVQDQIDLEVLKWTQPFIKVSGN
jgi:hypothetical protein